METRKQKLRQYLYNLPLKRDIEDLINRLNLSTPEREILHLHYVSRITLSETSRILGVENAWCSKLHSKALSKIAEVIDIK